MVVCFEAAHDTFIGAEHVPYQFAEPSVKTYKAYAEALNALDIDRTRTYLHDDLTYQDPVGETQGADA